MAKQKSAARTVGTPAMVALADAGVEHAARAYEHDPRRELGYGLEAAAALGVEPARVFKTLVTTIDGTLTVAVVPVTTTVDLKALASAVGGKKALMADHGAVERATGYLIGGISPIGQKHRLRTVIDASATEHDTVLVSAGHRGLDVELAPADLVALTGATLAPIARPDR